jgi:regulator of protease activity HflC (stomatin/prohibitin superfamily)
MSMYSSRPGGPSGGAVAGVAVAVIVVIVVIIWAVNSFTSTDPGFIGLVRNGGPFDNTQLQRDADGNPVIVPPGSGLTNVGFASSLRQYPVTNRYWTIDPDGGDTNQAVDVPTKDGVNVGVSGQFVFGLNQAPKVLAAFDEAYGSRTFTDPAGNQVKASDGTDAGFNAFLAAFVPNTVNNALRQEMGRINCKDVIASCVLVQNNAGGAIDPNINNQGAIAAIQDAVNRNFEEAVNAQLGGPYLVHAAFNLSKVSLPAELQQKVNDAQGAFAQVSQAQARVQSAQADAQATAAKSQAYQQCPGCLQIDIIKALPPGITVYAPGNSNVAIPAGR